MKFGILTKDSPNELSCMFEMFILKIVQVIQEYMSVAFLCTEYICSLQTNKQNVKQQ